MASRESRGVARGSSRRRDWSKERPPEFSGENSEELRIVLLGRSGAGKSATGNTILGREVYRTGRSPDSVTQECQRESAELNGRHITVIDTPGLFNTELSNEEVQTEISNCISMILPGPHVLIIVLNLGRFVEEEQRSVKIIQEMFGEKTLMYTMLLFTRGDYLKDMTIEQYLKRIPPLMELTEACGNRYHVFNNNEPGDRTQVCDLLQKIDGMVKVNGGGFYSYEMFYRRMDREGLEQQMEILMDRVRERGEEMRKLEEEKDRMKKMMEEERQNQDKERKRREEEYRTQIKEKEREIHEAMKREREDWEKQKLEEKMRGEEEKLKHEQDKLIKRHQTAEPGAEGEADDLEQLRIVLIGRTGSGKSATGNSILGRDEFVSQLSMSCQKGVSEADGRSVAVVDTPGLFDTTLPNDQVIENLMKCVSMSAPGPHVFVIVLSLGRFHRDEMDTVDLIKRLFGPKTAQFSIVLFTGGDGLGDESVEDYVNRSKSAELKKLIRDCGNRFLAFNNREKQDRTQVIQLLNMIEELKHMNEGQYFTNSMFEEAEMSIKKRTKEIMNEKAREIKTQHEAINTIYEMEMKNMMKRLEEEKQRADEERMKTQNQLREKEEKLRKEFEEKEKREQMKQETENQKRLDEEKQKRAEHHTKIEELKGEIENQRLQYDKQQKEREEEDRKREEKYRRDLETMRNEHGHIIAELQTRYEEEIKRRDLEKHRRNAEEEEERQRWRGRIKEAENDRKEIKEELKQQQREWEEEKKRQMREREEEERQRKEKHEEQLREKREELEKMRERFESEREEERQKIEEERQIQRREREEKERAYEEKIHEMKRLEREREEEWERRKREDDERREEERKRWTKMIEDVKREQEEEIMRREEEEKERKEREEKEQDEMKQKHEEEIRVLKTSHEEEARRQAERTDFRERKEHQHVQQIQQMLEERQEQHELLKELQERKEEEIKELRQEIQRLNNRSYCAIL